MANHSERRAMAKLDPVRRATPEPPTFPAGARFAPTYRVGAKTGLDRALIHDNDFVSDTDPDEAARVAHDRRIQTEMVGLYWDGKVAVIQPTGIACVHGSVGPFEVLFIEGPIFERTKASDRSLMAKVAGYSVPAAKVDVRVEDA